MSRKSGNNTGVQDSSLNKSDSMKAKSDGDEVISPKCFYQVSAKFNTALR